ncbi:MAG: DNA-deoxyinosine glycosylase [Lachnospiraceae bacterium]|nr:DNA-deoxyinosine glycosylase [Lachnospiraceae bacterium]
MSDYESHTHEFEPVYNRNSRVLILGTFPSVKSREQHFYYGHPQNRFWKVIAALTNAPVPASIPEKKELLLSNGIAVWDVIASCDIIGSSDTSIKNVIPADIPAVLSNSSIKQIYGNGAKACQLYDKYLLPKTNLPIQKLPSTSPANAAFSLEKLIESWQVIVTPL